MTPRVFLIATVFIVIFAPISGQSQVLKTARSFAQQKISDLPGNSISDILIQDMSVWLGTGSGLAVTEDGGVTFTNFRDSPGMGKGGISALAQRNGKIWVATAFDTVVNDETLSGGGGLSWSNDGGNNWNHIGQPVDPNLEEELGYKPTTTIIQNVTFDIAFDGSTIWIASWGGGLRKSMDDGTTWSVVTPDGFPFDAFGNLNHRAFTIITAENGLWVGTAQGISKSTDGGHMWTHYTAQNVSGISGNFITQLAEQKTPNGSIIWAAAWKAEDENEFYGVSRTANNGLTWETMLAGEFAHNFGFNGDAVYVATDNGLFKSPDRGKTWGQFPSISDEQGRKILTSEFFDVKFHDGVLWLGTDDGLVKSIDDGFNWNVVRAFVPPGVDGEPEVYAYPNPFSPLRHNRLGETGNVRIQYRTIRETEVSLDIFDFGMNLVKNVATGRSRPVPGDYSELWDGTNNWGVMVANGVYFYRLQVRDYKTVWGKIIVLN